MSWSYFKIVRVNGLSMTTTYSENLPSGEYGVHVVVSNGYVALITQIYSPVASTRIKLYHNSFGGVVTGLKLYEREGYYLTSRELNGRLSVITQHYTIYDLEWT